MPPIVESLAPIAVSFTKAAELTSVSKNTLRRFAKTGKLRTSRLGRRRVIIYADLREFVGSRTQEQPALVESGQ